MRFDAILRESWKNLCSGTTRAGLLALVFGSITSGLVLADALTAEQIIRRAEQYHLSGASVQILSAPGKIDGSACENLARLPGIQEAGALRFSTSRIAPAVLPGSPLPEMEVSPGLVELLGGNVQRPGVLVGPEVMDALGRGQMASLAVVGGTSLTVGGSYAYADDGRRGGLGYAALAPALPSGIFDECWADIWPCDEQLSQLLFTTVRPGQSVNKPELFQLNASHGKTFDAAADLQSRITRFAAPAALALGSMLGFWSLFRRRLHIASDLHAGVSRRSLMTILFIETSVWLIVSVAVSESVGLMTSQLIEEHSGLTIARLTTQTVGSAVVGALVGALAAFALTREDQLFRYFKARS